MFFPFFGSAVLMFLGVVIYPSGWDHPVVRSVCGQDAVKYYPGGCGIRWAYILAILGLFDAIVLSALAFVLGTRYIRLSETIVTNRDTASMYKGIQLIFRKKYVHREIPHLPITFSLYTVQFFVLDFFTRNSTIFQSLQEIKHGLCSLPCVGDVNSAYTGTGIPADAQSGKMSARWRHL